MGYSKEIYDKAIKIKNDAIKEMQNTYDAKISELRQNSEEFRNIEFSLSKAGSSIALAALSGDTKKLEELKDFCAKNTDRKNEILDSLGIKKPQPICKKCNDSGYFESKLCSCISDIAKKIAYEELSKSLPLDEFSFDNFDLNYYQDKPDENGNNPRKRAETILNVCKGFVEGFPKQSRSLLFMGNAGLGKTHLSLAIVSAISSRGYGVVYGSAQSLFSAAEKEHFSFSGETTVEDSVLNCDLLVIDDLGTEFYSSYAASMFYNIVNTRILNHKPTIINTNLDFSQLKERYSARITSRFIGEYDMRSFIGADIRQKKALEKNN